MTVTAVEFQTKVDKAAVNMDRFDLVVNGDANTVVTTDSGSVPTFAKALADAQASVAVSTATAQGAASSATTAFHNFDVRYLGAKASDPTVDNTGGALAAGAIYWSTSLNAFRVWTGSAWQTRSTVGQRAQVRAVATSNVTIATALNNGDVLDGITLATNDLVLLPAQTNAYENGIYVVQASPVRATAFDTFDEHIDCLITVREGTANSGTVWYCTANAGGTLNTTAIPFTKLNFYSGMVAPDQVTAGRTLSADDTKRILLANIAGPGADALATITVPSNSVDPLPIGTMYEIVRTGGSTIRFASDSAGAAVIVGPAAGQTLTGDNAWARLLKEGTNQWRLYGVLGNAPATAIAPKIWFDASDLSTMKQERTGAAATTAVDVGQPVGSWRNKGSLGGWAVIDADAKRPILQQTNGYYEVVFDGVDDLLRLPTPALNLASIEIYLGFRYSGTTSANDGLLTLAPTTSNDYNQHNGMSFYLSANGTQYNWVGDGNGTGGSTMIVSAGGVMAKNAHTVELRKTAANAATMTLDRNNSPAQVNQSSATTAFTTQGGDLILGARQGNGVVTWGHVAIRSVVITNEPVADPTSIRAYEEVSTYGTVPVYPNIADTTQLSAARATLISQLFSASGGVLPTALGTLAIESPNPLAGTTNFTNLNKCEKMTIPGYAARPRLWTPNSPRNDVIFLVCAGHAAGWDANGIATNVMQPLLTANVRVCTFVLPGGPNDYTSGGPTDHESGIFTLADWIGPVVIAINKLKADFPGAAIHMTGISGGGWMTTMSAACDARITKSYQFVGSLPDMIYLNRDFEQRLDGLTADYLTLYMLAACPGRRHMQVLYENDPVAFNRTNFSTRPDYSAQMTTRAAAIGGGNYTLSWVNYNLHAYQGAFSTLVIPELP